MRIIATSVNPHFRDYIFNWNFSYYVLCGGYGSSKSYNTALKIILKLIREKRTCLVVRNVFETLRESCFTLFQQVAAGLNLELSFTKSPMSVVFENGSKIIFKGLDVPAKLKSIVDVSLIWIEEASEITYSAFKELVGRLRHPYLPLHMILTSNPAQKSNWLYKHFFEGIDEEEFYKEKILREGEVYYHHSTVDDNIFLPESYRKTLEDMKTYDVDLYRVARLGRFGSFGTKVLPQFKVIDSKEMFAQIEGQKIFRNGLDFGFETSFNALIRVAVDVENRRLYIFDEYYKNHQMDIELAQALKPLLGRELVKCDSAEPKAIKTLRSYGINAVAAKKWNGGTRHARLDNLRKVKSFKDIFCSSECIHCIEEMADLVYKQDRNGNIIEDEFNIDSHELSALWYALDDIEIVSAKKTLRRSDLGL